MIRDAISVYLKGLRFIMSHPTWKNRRRYIFASFAIGAFMLIAGSLAALTGTMTDISDLVTGGVALITLILTSYIFGAVWEDKSKQSKEVNPDG